MMVDQLFSTDPDPFDLDDGVPVDLIYAQAGARAAGKKMSVKLPEGSSYLRIEDTVLDDGAVCDVLADAGTVGIAAWFALMVAAKKARAFGMVEVHAHRFGGSFGATAVDAMAAIDSMERAGLVWVKRDTQHRFRAVVRIRNWQKWQSLTDAERKRLDRRSERSSSADSGQRPQKTDGVQIDRTTGAHKDEHEDEQITAIVPEGTRPEPSGPPSMPGLDFDPVDDPILPAPPKAKRQPTPIPMEQVREVFEHWRVTFGKTRANKLDPQRTLRIRWALKTYGMDETRRCIDGYRRDPWRDRPKNCDLELLFRNAKNFERGLELADGTKGAHGGKTISDRASRFARRGQAATAAV